MVSGQPAERFLGEGGTKLRKFDLRGGHPRSARGGDPRDPAVDAVGRPEPIGPVDDLEREGTPDTAEAREENPHRRYSPKTIGADKFRSAFATLSGTTRPVFGLSDGSFSTRRKSRPKCPTTSTSCTLRTTVGSA